MILFFFFFLDFIFNEKGKNGLYLVLENTQFKV